MKRVLSLVLLLAMLVSLSACGQKTPQTEAASPIASEDVSATPKAEESPAELSGEASDVNEGYNLGDKMPDFTVTLDDGSEVSLYSLVGQKKAVMVNLWSNSCPPCKNEFQYMEQAYNDMSDEIGILALSMGDLDTFETIAKVRSECKIPTVPMGLDEPGLFDLFGFHAMPGTVVLDRNGIICFKEEGALPSKDHFVRLFSAFTADDYSDSVILNEVPPVIPTALQPDETDVKAALGIEDDSVSVATVSADGVWPFIIADDNTLSPSNIYNPYTMSTLDLEVNADDAAGMSFEYLSDYAFYHQGGFGVEVDDTAVLLLDSTKEWTPAFISFDGAKNPTVTFKYENAPFEGDDANIRIRNVSLLSADELAEKESNVKRPNVFATESHAKLEIKEGETIALNFVDGGVPDSEGMFFMAPTGKLSLRIRLAEDVNPMTAAVMSDAGVALVGKLPFDDDGYIYDWTPGSGYGFHRVVVYTDSDDEGEHNMLFLFEAESNVQEFFEYAFLIGDYDESSTYWEYADGREKTQDEKATDSETESYSVTVLDEDGNGVEGVMIQLCDAESCQVFITDADGHVPMQEIEQNYDVHVVKVPDGFEKDTMLYNLYKGGETLTITLHK